MRSLVLATTNAGKVRELRALLAPLGWQVLSLADVGPLPPVVEDGATFADNAVKKARVVYAHTALPAVADDSGLCVDALDGAPGVYSARYGGAVDDAGRCALLLEALAGVPAAVRTAHFACALAYVDAHGVRVFHGRLDGRIAETPCGQGGFGYDPVFLPTNESRTLAQMRPEEKNAVSHRGRAVAALVDWLSAHRR